MFLVSDGEQATSVTFMKRRIHKCNERSRIQSLTIPLKIWGSGGEKKILLLHLRLEYSAQTKTYIKHPCWQHSDLWKGQKQLGKAQEP